MRCIPHYRRVLSGIVLVLAMTALGGADLMAQRFQYAFGSSGCRESARHGVKQLASGGYIAVGESFSPTSNCTNSDIYVVRTNDDGSLLWTNTYDIGSLDSATDVIEDSNGDFVICGVTRQSACNPDRDIFLLKIGPAGLTPNAVTYGASGLDDIAWNLVEATTGSGPTAPGDYIVVGATSPTAGATDGYILRTDVNLTFIWDRSYDAGGTNNNDVFYGVCEALQNAPAAAADIVAVGYSESTFGSGAKDVYLVRVDGGSGTTTTSSQGEALYGGALDDEGRAVIELQTGLNAGNIVVAGISFSRPTSSNSEVLMLTTGPTPCSLTQASFSGDNGTRADGALDLKENPFSSGALQDVIVTGFTGFGNVILTGKNVFLQRYLISSMFTSGAGVAYGGNGDDEGWSVNIATNVSSTPSQTLGFVVAGYTKSPNLIPTSNPEQMYLIKTNTSLLSFCNQALFNFNATTATLSSWCGPGNQGTVNLWCPTGTAMGSTIEVTPLCYSFTGTRQQNGGGNDGVSGVESPAVISFSEGTVTSYPNPLASGQDLALRFDLASTASAEIIISDLLGRIVHRETAAIEGGQGVHPVKTWGWSAGSYQISIRIGETIRTARVVLLDD